MEVHEHFRKANILHTYVQKNLGEATKHALETGRELLAAKTAIPHGRWEDECARLFDGSARTAQFYMRFARDFSLLKSAEKSALLMLEGTLDGAAKAARKAAKPAKRKTSPPSGPVDSEEQQVDSGEQEPDFDAISNDSEESEESEEVDYGKCPNCLGTKWDEDEDGVFCAKCQHPHGVPADGKATPRKPIHAGPENAPAQYARQQIKIWADTIGRWLGQSPSIDEYRNKWPGPKGDRVVKAATELYEALKLWGKEIK